MLVEFRVANFRSFHEEQTFSLVASKDVKHPGNLIPGEKFNLLKAAAIYGPNASGKSNLIKAIDFMASFIRDSATKMNQGDKIPFVTPFRLAPDSRAKPSSFEITVNVDETRFEYGFSTTAERVHEEWLNAYPPKGRRQGWFERKFDPATKETAWTFRRPLKTEERILKQKTRDNGLALSRGAELSIKALSDLFLWIRMSLSVYDLSDRPTDLMRRSAERVMEDETFRERVGQMIRHADFGIDGISLARESVPIEVLPKRMQSFVVELSEKHGWPPSITGTTIHTIHRVFDADAHEQFDIGEDESNGTQRFFALAGPVLDALDNSRVLVVDELDCSMHPLLTRKLIELFQSPEANRNGAQLVFATHDSTFMDPELFRRDQIWLVEKNRSGASEIFSLYDFDTEERPRNTEAFQRNYLAGRYGGVPNFGPIFEDLQLK